MIIQLKHILRLKAEFKAEFSRGMDYRASGIINININLYLSH